jgi:cyclase
MATFIPAFQRRSTMRLVELAQDVEVIVGEAYESNTTVFYAPGGALLVDTLGSRADARALIDHVERVRRTPIRLVISTHGFSDHMAGLGLLPGAVRMAHRELLATFDRERFRTQEEASFRAEPHLCVEAPVTVRWGRHDLHVRPLGGHTESTLGIDVPSMDMVFVGDSAVGNIAYVLYADRPRLRAALEWALDTGRRRVIQGHSGPHPRSTLSSALHYLDGLEAHERQIARSRDVPVESFLPRGIKTSETERFFHARNVAHAA